MIFWMKAGFQHSFKYSKHLFLDTISHFIQIQMIFFTLLFIQNTSNILIWGQLETKCVVVLSVLPMNWKKNLLLAKLYLQVPCPVLILQSLSVFSSNCGCFKQNIHIYLSVKLILAWSLSTMGKVFWFMTLKNLVLFLHYLKTNLKRN